MAMQASDQLPAIRYDAFISYENRTVSVGAVITALEARAASERGLSRLVVASFDDSADEVDIRQRVFVAFEPEDEENQDFDFIL